MLKHIYREISKFFARPDAAVYIILLIILSLMGYLFVPILFKILPHPDEYQFYGNAWSIMSGKQLQNFFHVAVTEYLLAVYLSFLNVVMKSGVNFPQGEPSLVTYAYARILCFILMLLTFLVGSLLLQKGDKFLKPRIIFFAVLFFGSIGIFERFMRVNSDSMSIFVGLNYILVSLWLHQKKAPTWQFLICNIIFIFLASFTNLKTLYLVIPMFLFNQCLPFLFYEKYTPGRAAFPRIYRFILYFFAVLAGSVVLWYVCIPKPVDPKIFWYTVKNSTVQATTQESEYPDQARNSGVAYMYDLVVEQIGVTQMIALIVFSTFAFAIGRKKLFAYIFTSVKNQFALTNFQSGNLYNSLELIILLSAVSYFIGISTTVIHYSRWGAPLAVLLILLISVYLEKLLMFLLIDTKVKKVALFSSLLTLFVVSWSLMYMLVRDISLSDYPNSGAFKRDIEDIDNIIQQEGYMLEQGPQKFAWFIGSIGHASNISIDELVKPEYAGIRYILWPYWNIGLLYSLDQPVNKETHNIRAFVKTYAESVSFRFPTFMGKYMHYTQYFMYRVLGVTWYPEIASLTEQQYGIVKIPVPHKMIKLHYEVPYNGLEHYYSSDSSLFTLVTLHDSYVFPPCYHNPEVKSVSTGDPAPYSKNPLILSRTAGLYCHSLAFRVLLKGNYEIHIEGLPDNSDDSQRVYSAFPYDWGWRTKTFRIKMTDTRITGAFGVATKEKYIPNLKFIVDYTLDENDLITPTPTPTPALSATPSPTLTPTPAE